MQIRKQLVNNFKKNIYTGITWEGYLWNDVALLGG